jgi:SAM-dependent MidA family methyltransferase
MTAPCSIRRAITEAGGAIPFSEFQRLALYGPEGFYVAAGGGRAGRRGDFLTSAEVGPLFGTVLARFLDAQWEALGRPERFTVVEAGAGPGTLARSILATKPDCEVALHYIAVELSATQRAMHPVGVDSREELPDSAFDGVIIANELLDNVPARLCVFDGRWREAFVVANPDGTFGEVLSSPLDPPPPVLPPSPPHGSRAPLHDEAREWVIRARSLLRGGRLLCFDFAAPSTAVLALRPWRDWLRTYRRHERGGHYLADAGLQDITVELALDQFPEPDAVRTQGQFLRRWGIDELISEGDREWEAGAAAPDLRSLAMRSRRVEAGALLDPGGLGSFAAIEWSATGTRV